jgi:hypothetical protein
MLSFAWVSWLTPVPEPSCHSLKTHHRVLHLLGVRAHHVGLRLERFHAPAVRVIGALQVVSRRLNERLQGFHRLINGVVDLGHLEVELVHAASRGGGVRAGGATGSERDPGGEKNGKDEFLNTLHRDLLDSVEAQVGTVKPMARGAVQGLA